MHITRHLERCTKHSTSKDAHNKAPRRMHKTQKPEGDDFLKTPETPHNKAPRRMHKTQHLEGCTSQGILKGAQNTATRRMHTTYTLRSNAKLTFEQKKRLQWITSGPAQVFCNAASGTSKAESLPAHRYLRVVHVLQHGNTYKQILKLPKQIPTS